MGKGVADGNAVGTLGAIEVADGLPDLALVGVGLKNLTVGDFLADHHDQPAVEAEDVAAGEQGVFPGDAGAVFGVEVDELLGPREVGFGSGGAPEGGVEAGVKAVMDRQEPPYVVP